MPTVEYPTNPNTDTAFVTDDGGKRTRSLKTVLVDGTIDYPKNANVKDCYVTIDGKKQRALMTADVSKDGVVEYPDGSNSTKGYVTVDGKKHRVVLTAVLAGGAPDPVIAELNVTPTTSAQTITPPEGTDGYGPVNVSAVTASIDANIQAGNIKKDVSILGVTGSYEAPIPTGTIQITTNGTHNVSGYASADVNVPTSAPTYYITYSEVSGKLVKAGPMMNLGGITKLASYALMNAFYNNSGLTGNIDLSTLTALDEMSSLEYAFYQCTNISSVDLSGLTRVTGSKACYNAFANCNSVTSVDLKNLEVVSAPTACQSFFENCSNLQTLDLSKLKTVSGNYAMANSFANTKIATIDLSNLEEVSSTSGASNMFRNTRLQIVTFPSLKTLTGQYAMLQIFNGCSSLTSVSFPALTSTSFGSRTDQFYYMLVNCSNVTVHFPSNLQSVIGSWSDVTSGFGGTNTTVLFDLPATA